MAGYKMIDLFMDSGAFSAVSYNKPIVLWDYIEFLHEYYDIISHYVVLDIIGDAEKTWENQKIMEDTGLSPIPVYHIEDDIRFLYKCLEYPFFALGGMAGGTSTNARKSFLDKCFEIICDTPDNLPKRPVHGFGIMSPELIVKYPFYSVDTSSYVDYSQYAMLLIPKVGTAGEYLWGKTPNKVFVSARSPKVSILGKHIKNMHKAEKQKVVDFIHEMGFQVGTSHMKTVPEKYKKQENENWVNRDKRIVEVVDIEGVSNSNMLRYLFNAKYFQKIADSIPKWPWPWRPTIRRLF